MVRAVGGVCLRRSSLFEKQQLNYLDRDFVSPMAVTTLSRCTNWPKLELSDDEDAADQRHVRIKSSDRYSGRRVAA